MRSRAPPTYARNMSDSPLRPSSRVRANPSTRRIAAAEQTAAITGSLLVIGSLGIIWGSRLTVPRSLYVSELGADGEPTARAFEGALLLLVVGAGAIAWAGRRIRSRAWLLRRWAPSISLWVSAAGFLLASQVPCTSGCPLPLGDTFSVQDLVHTVAAVVSFAAACVAMLQMAVADGRRELAIISFGAGSSVAVIAAAGGILSLLRVGTDLGSVLELIATTVAMLWLAALGVSVARQDLVDVRQGGAVEDLAVVPEYQWRDRSRDPGAMRRACHSPSVES